MLNKGYNVNGPGCTAKINRCKGIKESIIIENSRSWLSGTAFYIK